MTRKTLGKQSLVLVGLVILALAASACAGPGSGLPAAAQEPPPSSGAEHDAEGGSGAAPPSAGAPEGAPEAAPEAASELSEAEIIAGRAKTAAAALDLPWTASWDVSFRTADPDLLFACDYIPNSGFHEIPLLICEYGESEDRLTGHARLWKEGGEWQAEINPEYGQDGYSLPVHSSAATPGVPPGRALENAGLILERAREAVQALDLSAAEAGYQEVRITDPDLIFTCQYSPGRGGDEVPLSTCKFGEFYNTVIGHALFWLDGGDWQAQLYPQAPEDLAAERYRLFASWGSNCCGSVFRAVRQEGSEALVVVDLSGVGTRSNHEVHLLRREGQEWHVVWAPLPRDFGFRFRPSQKRTPTVSLPAEGIDWFDVRYEDGTVDTWIRSGDAYVRRPAQR